MHEDHVGTGPGLDVPDRRGADEHVAPGRARRNARVLVHRPAEDRQRDDEKDGQGDERRPELLDGAQRALAQASPSASGPASMSLSTFCASRSMTATFRLESHDT